MRWAGLFTFYAIIFVGTTELIYVWFNIDGGEFSLIRAILKGLIFAVLMTAFTYYQDKRKRNNGR